MSHEERSIYSTETGLFTGVIIAVHDDLLEANTPSGHKTLTGRYDRLSRRVDLTTGEVIEYQPPAPSSDHEWNASTQRWQLSAAAAEKESNRALALNRIDHLENSQARALRELAVGTPAEQVEARARLKAIHDEIVSLRSQVGP